VTGLPLDDIGSDTYAGTDGSGVDLGLLEPRSALVFRMGGGGCCSEWQGLN